MAAAPPRLTAIMLATRPGNRTLAGAATWDPADLLGRVSRALEIAESAVCLLPAADAIGAGHGPSLPPDKVIAETAMLLVSVAAVRGLDARIGRQADAVLTLLLPLARSAEIRARICMDPGQAHDLSVAHVLLDRLGHPDPAFDALLAECRGLGAEFGPERLPHRRLEQAWLWPGGAAGRSRLIACSMLGRRLDALGASRLDLYAFTHAVMYASDLGGRSVTLPRRRAEIAADAVAALARALDTDDCDLAAEVAATWPMLGLPWSPAAAFGFATLAGIEDGLGFLPGGAFRAADHQCLTREQRPHYVAETSYHAVYVMAFLCAAALRPGRAPPATVPEARDARRGAAAAILSLLDAEAPPACWRGRLAALGQRRQDAVAPLLLSILLQRARMRGDIGLLREALEVALRHDLAAAPAPMQAAALLRRCRWLGPPAESDILPGRHLL